MADADATRGRILEATYACVEREGLAGTTLEVAAREAGVARATIYRHFPGGREELVAAVVSWSVGQFFTELVAGVDPGLELADWLVGLLGAAQRRLDQHYVLHDVLREDAGQLLPPLAAVGPIVLGLLRQELSTRLAGLPSGRLRPGVAIGDAADLVARMTLSFMGTPGSWHLDQPGELRRLVEEHLLAGVLAPPAPSPHH